MKEENADFSLFFCLTYNFLMLRITHCHLKIKCSAISSGHFIPLCELFMSLMSDLLIGETAYSSNTADQ